MILVMRLNLRVTNYKNGNIKHFRIRYWNKDKQIKIMDLEKNDFSDNTIRKKILGKVEGSYNGERFNFNTIDKDCRLGYNSLTDEYLLYVPVSAKCKKTQSSGLISLDPGIRTFITGITNNKIVKIGKDTRAIICDKLKKIDSIKNNTTINKKRKDIMK
jgi:hypothetical protein